MADIRYNNSFSLAGGFNITNAEPIDSRMYVADIQHIYSDDNWVKVKPYPGLIVSAPDGEVRICINSDYKLESSWKKIGGGNVSVSTFEDAKSLATEDNLGQVIFVSSESVAYIVTGENILMKLATSTAGDIDNIVATLQSDVQNLQKTVSSEEDGLIKKVADNSKAIEELNKIDHDAYITADTVLENKLTGEINKKLDSSIFDEKIDEIEESLGNKAEQTTVNELTTTVNGLVNNKVDKVDGERLMTDAEGTKLAGIAEGAQVNIIEKIKVNGEELIVANADKSVEITIPEASVKGITSKDGQILTLSEDGKLDTTLSIAYVKATESENAVLRLQGVDGKVISSIDATEFIKDGMIQSVTLDGPNNEETGTKYLVITWNTDAGKDITRLDVSELFNPYTAGNGINLNSGEFSIKLKAGEQYIDVDAEGLKTTQALWDKVTELDNNVLSSANGTAKELADAAEANAKKYADDEIVKAVEVLEDVDTELGNRIKSIEDTLTEKESKWDIAEQNAKDYADENFVTKEGFNEFEAEYEEKLNNIAEGAQVNVIESVSVNGIEANINENKVASIEIKANDIELGTSITNGEEEKYSADTKISSVLQGIQDSISNAITSAFEKVEAGDGVDITEVANNKQTISVKVSNDEGNLLKVNENGLFVAMYYDGDDAE